MIEYTRKYLHQVAKDETRAVTMATAAPARLVDWKLILNGAGGHSLVVLIRAADGFRQRYVAI
jgi:hypothetical protein